MNVALKTARKYQAEWEAAVAECLTSGHDWQPEDSDPGGQEPMRCYRCGITEAEAASA